MGGLVGQTRFRRFREFLGRRRLKGTWRSCGTCIWPFSSPLLHFFVTEALSRGAHHHLRASAKKGAAHRPGRHALTPSHRASNDVTKVVMNDWSEERKDDFMKAL